MPVLQKSITLHRSCLPFLKIKRHISSFKCMHAPFMLHLDHKSVVFLKSLLELESFHKAFYKYRLSQNVNKFGKNGSALKSDE